MPHITLVLPHLLPLPEFAPDLARALQTPALAALLSRTSVYDRRGAAAPPDGAQALPHEAWLARALGLSPEGRPAFAVSAMRGFGLDPQDGTWYIVNPAHIQIARSHSMMADPRQLQLDQPDSRALYEAARPLCEEIGHPLLYGDAQTWFLRADDWDGIDSATPDTVAGMDLSDFVPRGRHAQPLRRLQNEVQMLWHAHPVNAAREKRRLPAVNSFWLWGAATAVSGGPPPALPVIALDAPGWVRGLATRSLERVDGVEELLAADGIVVAGSLAEAALAADWGSWVQGVQQLEQALFAPLHAALLGGRIQTLRLVLSSRDALAECTTTAMAQRKFWRRPTLERLT